MLAANHLRFTSFFSSPVPRFGDGIGRSANDKLAANHVRLTNVVASSLNSPELDWGSIIELLDTGDREGTLSAASGKDHRRQFLWLWFMVSVCQQFSRNSTVLNTVALPLLSLEPSANDSLFL